MWHHSALLIHKMCNMYIIQYQYLVDTVYTALGMCKCRVVREIVLQAAVSFIAFPRESTMMSSACVSSTVKTPFPGLTAELGLKSFCSLDILQKKCTYSPLHSHQVFSFLTLTLTQAHTLSGHIYEHNCASGVDKHFQSFSIFIYKMKLVKIL